MSETASHASNDHAEDESPPITGSRTSPLSPRMTNQPSAAAAAVVTTLSHGSGTAAVQASDNTSAASSQQTRFSFYNAEDFKVVLPKTIATSPPAVVIEQALTPHESLPAPPVPAERYSFYNADEVKRMQTVVQTVEQQHNHNPIVSTERSPKVDSVEILKSLQEHEQQRLEILAGPKNKALVENSSGFLEATNDSLLNQQHGTSLPSNPNTSHESGGYSSENSNPYEDAINEALQLLRKHRATSSFRSRRGVPDASATAHSDPLVPSAIHSDGTHGTAETSDDVLQREFQDLMIRATTARSPPSTRTGLDPTWPPPSVTPGLGDAYQMEIEARRKQRQERMARYASRLAELKQDDNEPTSAVDASDDRVLLPVVDTSRDDQTLYDQAMGIARGSGGQQYYWNNLPASQDREDWDEDAIVASRSEDQRGYYEPSTIALPALSQTGSLSTLSNTNKLEDEVQRGVERVLLAILERANSRGRSGGMSTTAAAAAAAAGVLEQSYYNAPSNAMDTNSDDETRHHRHHPISPPDEEKKSNPEDHAVQKYQQDDALVRAMTELLGPRTLSAAATGVSSIGSSHRPYGEAGDDPSLSLATQEPTSPFAASTTSQHDSINHHIAFPSMIVNTDGLRQPYDSALKSPDLSDAAHFDVPVDRTPFQFARQSNAKIDDSDLNDESGSLLDDPIVAPVETLSSRNLDNDTSDHSDSSKDEDETSRSSDALSSGSDVDDKDTLEEALGADGDESEIYDERSSADEYDDSDQSNARRKGVLGPLSKRLGGTTGVVLEDDSSSCTSSSEENNGRGTISPPTILESLTAAVSRVTGIASSEDKQTSPSSRSRVDKYSCDAVKSNDTSDMDSEANDLMRSLCAHLLPVEVDQSSRFLDTIPEWDESNPDEAGYRIVRLNRLQLRRVQKEYDRLFASLPQVFLKASDAIVDASFERDLKDSEQLLDRAEQISKAPTSGSVPSAVATAVESDHEATDKKADESELLAGFPGVKSAGKGEMGDLEYFTLPIIFKSHVTGFEPTKDLLLEPGNVLAGQYLVEGILGSAAFSTAYKCVDLGSEEDSSGCQDLVCLKIIKNTKDFFDQSLDEIKILELLRQTGKCNENFIIEMKSFFYHREHLVIVTELLRQNLFEFGKFILDSGEEPYFTITRLSYITWQCLVALNFVHGIGLVHSDVKPENILLASYSRAMVKLIDFGSSCYLTDRQSSYIQSRSYRAPEVVLGLPYDGRIDIWSLGCVVAEMFTGEVTFQNDSIVSMLSRIESIAGPFPRHMIAQGRQSSRFFTKCGLLYEKVPEDNTESHDSYSGESSNDDDDGKRKSALIDVFQPKRTSLAARLGFAPDLMEKFDKEMDLSREERRQATFCDLVRKLLTIDPEVRLTAAQALDHPAMLYAATLTEADVKYPSV